jgi:hypothetical protein
MGRGAVSLAAFLLASVIVATSAAGVSGETTHVFSVTLTIYVDRGEHKVKGTISSPDAPSEFCDQGMIRLMQVLPGKDKKANFDKPTDGRWGFRTTSRLRGERVYAEVLEYKIPGRPVICKGARSRAVTAP